MNRDVCGFSLSFFMHASILGICIYMLPTLDLQPKPMVIDFFTYTRIQFPGYFGSASKAGETLKATSDNTGTSQAQATGPAKAGDSEKSA